MNPLPSFSISIFDSDMESRASIAKTLAMDVALAIPPVFNGKDLSKPWTIAIRDVLQKLKPNDWTMFPRDAHSSRGEFLVDACWWVEGYGAALISEFEWSPSWNEILKDFEKLLVIKAPLKLMIHHSSNGKTNSKKIEEALTKCLENYQHHIAGETYIFIEYLPHEFVRAFFWQAASNGTIPSVKFKEILASQKFKRVWSAVGTS